MPAIPNAKKDLFDLLYCVILVNLILLNECNLKKLSCHFGVLVTSLDMESVNFLLKRMGFTVLRSSLYISKNSILLGKSQD